MAVFTFSSKGSKPTDTNLITEIKQHCKDKGINFSALVIRLLRDWFKAELKDGE